ncbi:MAG: aldo/keto reductase [Propionibacteriaceae bacterium]|jgi:aryl-alcohol dehydrogenase-like predicted oxidoreductase|nr:aldo/keto reductase [Propionibacteriaceae bacterium]
MRTRSVGSSDLTVSALGLGTMTWGHGTAVTDVVAMLKRFLDAGGNLLDTAASYGYGEVEELIGHLTRRTVDRSDLVLATKAGYVVHNGVRVVDTSAKALLADLEGSLRRLRTDVIDLWQIHAWSDTPLEETLGAADAAVRSGKVRHVGVSNFIGWQLGAASAWQAALQQAPIVSTQAEYSLLSRGCEFEILPCAEALGIGFFPWSPLGRGVLTGKYREGTPPQSRGASHNLSWFVEPYLNPGPRRIVNAVATAAEGLRLTPAQVAYLWVRDAPGVTAPIVGCRTVEQLEPLLSIDTMELPAIVTSALDDVTGGPNPARQPAEEK